MNYNGFGQPFQQNSYYPTAYPSYQQPMAPTAKTISMISGRMVNDVKDIYPNEVPMDGSIGVYPENNGGHIYTKQWTPEGTINTVSYVPEIPQAQQMAIMNDIVERLERIERLIGRSGIVKKPQGKEASANE